MVRREFPELAALDESTRSAAREKPDGVIVDGKWTPLGD